MPGGTTRRRRARASAVLGALVLLGCTTVDSGDRSPADGYENAIAVGTIVDSAGRPVTGQRVRVEGFVPSGPFGLGCSEPCERNDADDLTDATGTYRLPLRSAYLVGEETNTDWIVSTKAASRDGVVAPARSSLEFEVNIQQQDVAALPLWTVDPVVTVDGWQVSVDTAAGRPPGLDRVAVVVTGDRDQVSRHGTSAVVDTRLLEAPVGGGAPLQVSASGASDVEVPHARGRTIYHQRASSAAVAVPLAPVPASRRATCTAHLDDGSAVDVTDRAGGCVLTDGDLGTHLSSWQRDQQRAALDPIGEDDDEGGRSTTTTELPEPPLPTEVTLALATPVDVSMVAVASGALGNLVDLSSDGTTWTPIGQAEPADDAGSQLALVSLSQPAPARFVRVRQPSGIIAAEISVWGPAPGPTSTPRLEAVPAEVPYREGGGERSDRSDGDEQLFPELQQARDGWPWIAMGTAVGLVSTLWFALWCWFRPGSTDRQRIRSRGNVRRFRWCRAVWLRTLAAIGAWPHALDVVRRVGRSAPAPAPSAPVLATGAGRLRRYLGADPGAPPVLLVHSAISGSSVLDLTPQASLVRSLQSAGRDVWLLDWDFRAAGPDVALEHLAWEVVLASQRIALECDAPEVPTIGYCLGGTIALLREAAWPSGAPLALVAPMVAGPVEGGTGGMAGLLADRRVHPLAALDERGRVPAAVVRESFHWLRPRALRTVRTWSMARRDPALAEGYAAMARWVWEHQDLPGGVLLDAVDLVRQGGFGPGWVVADEPVHLDRVRSRILVLCATRDHIVPPAQSRDLVGRTGGPVEVVEVDAGHVGMVLGLGSGGALHPAITAWLEGPSGTTGRRGRARRRRTSTRGAGPG